MKKMILAALVAVASLSANAQVWVGGEVGFNYNTKELGNGDIKTTTLALAPEVGYSLNDKWDIALALREEYGSQKDGESINSFRINPYARYTFFQTGKVGFFLDMGFSVGTVDNSIVNGMIVKENDSATTIGFGFRPGVKFAASDKVTLVASFGGLGYEQAKRGDLKESNFGFNVNSVGLQFGLYYSF